MPPMEVFLFEALSSVQVLTSTTMERSFYFAKCVNRFQRPRKNTQKKHFCLPEFDRIVCLDDSYELEIIEKIVLGIDLHHFVPYWSMAKAILLVKQRYPFDVSRIYQVLEII